MPALVGAPAPAEEAVEGDRVTQCRQGTLGAWVHDAVDFEVGEVEQLLPLLPAERASSGSRLVRLGVRDPGELGDGLSKDAPEQAGAVFAPVVLQVRGEIAKQLDRAPW